MLRAIIGALEKDTADPGTTIPTSMWLTVIDLGSETSLSDRFLLSFESDGSYYYSNPDGSTYHNDGSGSATYTAPDGNVYQK